MKYRPLVLYVFLVSLSGACTKSPIAPGGSITITVPSLTAPANGAQIANLKQPVTLTIVNATTTDTNAFVTYTFEVASDSAFTNKAVTKDAPQGSGATTSVTLDTLPAGKDYFWRVRATSGDSVGTFSGTLTFTIGPAIIIQAPTVASPTSGATVTSAKPTLTVNNAARSGPAGAITYLFEIASDSAFTKIVASGTVAEGSSQTSFTTPSSLSYKTTYYWHAKATDANNITGGFSTAALFTTAADPNEIWPGDQPPGTTGHAVKGDNWEEQDMISHGGARFHSPTLEMKRLFDLMDRGMDPQEAIDWMHDHGYPTNAAYYSRIEVIGIQYVYLAKIRGRWDVILRSEGE